MRRISIFGFLLLGLAFLGCGGGGGGNSGPSDPGGTALIAIVFSVGSGTSDEVVLSFDGREVARSQACSARGPACALTATVSGVRRGGHSVVLRVNRQSQAAMAYSFLGEVDYSDNSGVRSIPLQQRQVTLRVGDSVTYDISI